MSQAYKEALNVSKTLMRNGFDAYVVNANMQEQIYEASFKEGLPAVFDIACEANFDDLVRLFPHLEHSFETGVVGVLNAECVEIHFYNLNSADSANPENIFMWVTPRMLTRMGQMGLLPKGGLSRGCTPVAESEFDGFNDFKSGSISFVGLPEQTIKRNYALAIRALRFAANYDLPIEPISWMAILRSTQDVLNCITAKDFVAEWKQVQPENMWKFVKNLFDSQIMHGLIPEIAALEKISQTRNDNSAKTETVLHHTIEALKHYPADEWSYDWIGTVAVLFHDVGKLYTADFFMEQWTFYQHHSVGAQVTRRILRRLNFPASEIETICHLVKNHLAFSFTLTDRGLRRFNKIADNKRIIAMRHADIQAREASYTHYKHNLLYLEKSLQPEIMNEPLLNGNEIMEITKMKPGKEVGQIRDNLMQAQLKGTVKNIAEATDFVKKAAQDFLK